MSTNEIVLKTLEMTWEEQWNYLKNFFLSKNEYFKECEYCREEGEINNPHIIVISWNFRKQHLCQKKKNITIGKFTLNVKILWQTKIF